jgi:hypothetical protein
MTILSIKKIDDISTDLSKQGSDLSDKLSTLAWNDIAQCPWEDSFPYKPQVRFQIAHDRDHLVLRYEVHEEYVKAQYIRTNENVWEDSCVEFFISLDGRQHYYNFEFNVLGTGLIGYGTADKSTRYRLDPTVTERINTYTALSKQNGKKVYTIAWVVPKEVFKEAIVEGEVVHANFYKCGDSLPQPHYLAWNNIENPTPNFHLPQFFAEVVFEK